MTLAMNMAMSKMMRQTPASAQKRRSMKTGGAEEFENAGDLGEQQGLWEEQRDYAGEVMFHAVEMGA